MSTSTENQFSVNNLKPWQSILLGILAGIGLTCGIYLLSRPQKGEAITLLPIPTPAPIVIHVDGQVLKPGVYSIAQSARVKDTIEAAGGITSNADTTNINFASKIMDGEKLYIPAFGEELITDLPGDTRSGSITITAQLVNLNTATQGELETLPGIGPTKAAQILAYREEYGQFSSIEEIKNVPGIADKTFESLSNLITVTP